MEVAHGCSGLFCFGVGIYSCASSDKIPALDEVDTAASGCKSLVVFDRPEEASSMRPKAVKAVPRSWSGDLAPTATGATDSVSEKMYAFAFRRPLKQCDVSIDVDSDDDVFDSPQSPSRTQPGQQPDTTTAETKAEADAAWLMSDSSSPSRCFWLLLGPLSINCCRHRICHFGSYWSPLVFFIGPCVFQAGSPGQGESEGAGESEEEPGGGGGGGGRGRQSVFHSSNKSGR